MGTDHDTAAFAVNTIANWWQQVRKPLHPNASRLLICADGGGSNGYRTRLWKTELAGLAESTGLTITACHLPPGTSKWNKIEHRLFSHISMNWRGRPLTSHEVIVNTIAATTTSSGLTVRAELDEAAYPTGVKIPDKTWKPSKSTASRLRDDRCEAGGPPRETGHRNGVFNGVDYRPHQGYSEGYDPQSGYRHPDDRGGPSTFRPRSHMSAARSERHDSVHRPAKPAPGDPRSRESPMTTPEYYPQQLLEQGVVIGKDEDAIGRVGQVYLDNETGVVSWVTVKTGWFGTRQSFVPLEAATIRGAEVRVPYDKDTIKGAPHHEFGEQLSEQDEDDLYTYYRIGSVGGGDAPSYSRGAMSSTDHAEIAGVGTASSSDAGEYLTRSEGQLPGGTDNVGTGRPRLRRFLVTEQQTITVPVTHEEIRVVRDPADAGENLGDMRDR